MHEFFAPQCTASSLGPCAAGPGVVGAVYSVYFNFYIRVRTYTLCGGHVWGAVAYMERGSEDTKGGGGGRRGRAMSDERCGGQYGDGEGVDAREIDSTFASEPASRPRSGYNVKC